MNILLGIGNEMNGDDGIGVYVAKKLKSNEWKTINCATVPENFFYEIIKHKPKKIVMVDAADMGLKCGEIRRIRKEKIGKATFSTHSVPLSIFVSHLQKEIGTEVIIIGIQPKTMYGKISKEAKSSANKLIKMIKEEKIEEIEEL
ncbi:MAG: hydrogenase maturation peptidase HycI [Thermoplasmatales archaeon]|nr:hydrogenase maturation peptidase HycI [Thermoplasmatales archaeon]